MTVKETKQRIENELQLMAESFGNAAYLVKYDVDVEVNLLEDATEDVTSVFGSLSIGPEGAENDDRLFLPLDAELDEDDNVDEKQFEENLEKFKAKAIDIRNRILASNDYNAEVKAIIDDFDREMDEKYREEIERLNKVAKRNLVIASIATAAAAIIAVVILVIDKLG